MDLTSVKSIKFLCKQYGLRPSPRSGQNFLVSKESLEKIIDAAQLQKEDTVLEIGAGFGTLTLALLPKVKTVYSAEKDHRMITALNKLAVVSPSLRLIKGDILHERDYLIKNLEDLKYKLVANLPYNITSKVLRDFTEQKPRPKEMILLVQKEVAERIVSKPGEMSVLSVAVQFFGKPITVALVPRDHFWPKPAVDSVILKITDIGKDPCGYKKMLGKIKVKEFFGLIKIGFSAKRKQLHNNISAGFRIRDDLAHKILEKSGLDPSIRAQELSIEQWVKLANNIEF